MIYDDPEGTTLSTDELASVRSVITAAAAALPGKRFITAEGARHEEGKGPQPEVLTVTVSRVLS